MALLQIKKTDEGETFNKYLKSRMINKNKNVIQVVTGSTGSGKSYISLRIAELWYQYYLKKDFPIRNVCFSIEEVVKLLASGELRQGEIIIMEEGGVLLGSLDFQTKISKLFTYVLQSFRSMNLCLIINLPHLSMLNKTARMLLHCNFTTCGVNYSTKESEVKPFFHQVNQSTGKIYPKYPIVKFNGRARTIERFIYYIPSKELMSAYEIKKKKFVADLVEGFSEDFRRRQTEETIKMSRKELTKPESAAYELAIRGLNQIQIAEKLGKTQGTISRSLKRCEIKAYAVK